MDYYELLSKKNDKRMDLEELVCQVKKISVKDNKTLGRAMIEFKAKIKSDSRLKLTYEVKESRLKTIVYLEN